MKEKVILSISVGCTALILTMVMFTQFKTIEYTDIVALETMREAELRAELASWKSKYEEAELKMGDTNQKITEYQTQISSEQNATELLRQELIESQKTLGYTNVQGEGIVITLENGEEKVDRFDLISLINELKLAGAEAISINDERVVFKTDIALPTSEIFLINSRRISGPYTIKAIGEMKYLESAITIKNGYLDQRKTERKKSQLRNSNQYHHS